MPDEVADRLFAELDDSREREEGAIKRTVSPIRC